MKQFLTEGRGARSGLLISAVVLGVILILATWANYRSAREATATLHFGQARLLEREMFGAMRRIQDTPDLATIGTVLDSLLAEQLEQGLRYVALPDPEGGIAVSAGEPLGSAEMDAQMSQSDGERGFSLAVVGSRVRMALVRPRPTGPPPEGLPPGAPGGSSDARWGADRPPETAAQRPPDAQAEGRSRGGPEHWHRFSGIILEFEPLVASRLLERAEQLLVFGVIAALAMLFVATLSWGMSLRYERAKRHLEDERRLSLLGQMSAVLAHEIRNPLASLKGHAQLLTERLAPDSADRRKAERVVLEASRIEALTGDLLDFVRSGPLDRRPVDPAEIVRASAEEVDRHGFILELDSGPERWPLDGPRMQQVVTNLMRNAQQASPPGGPRPAVRLESKDDALILSVRDFGNGLPSGQEGRIFEPFFTTRTSGTGLGLAVARRIVELHGGALTAVDHPAGGAVFQVRIPGESG